MKQKRGIFRTNTPRKFLINSIQNYAKVDSKIKIINRIADNGLFAIQ